MSGGLETTSQSDGEAKAVDHYCRGCGYNLRGLTVPRCPECGRPFDPADPHTYRKHPIRRWVRPVTRAAIFVFTIVLLLAATWGWLYWGWCSEQRCLPLSKRSRSRARR